MRRVHRVTEFFVSLARVAANVTGAHASREWRSVESDAGARRKIREKSFVGGSLGAARTRRRKLFSRPSSNAARDACGGRGKFSTKFKTCVNRTRRIPVCTKIDATLRRVSYGLLQLSRATGLVQGGKRSGGRNIERKARLTLCEPGDCTRIRAPALESWVAAGSAVPRHP